MKAPEIPRTPYQGHRKELDAAKPKPKRDVWGFIVRAGFALTVITVFGVVSYESYTSHQESRPPTIKEYAALKKRCERAGLETWVFKNSVTAELIKVRCKDPSDILWNPMELDK